MNYVYIMTNKRNGTLYTGTTRNLFERVAQHKSKKIAGFTKDHDCNKLVYYKEFELAVDAIQTEKNMKKWPRLWKLRTIEKENPEWKDLSLEWN